MKGHAQKAAEFLADEPRSAWHDETLWMVRSKRDVAVHKIPEWESLREAASQIKEHVLSNLESYLMQFEQQALNNGIKVHWAVDAAEHNRICHQLLAERNATRVVKSKSMLTEECGLNGYLAQKGIEVIDSDLGERIVQLAEEEPSHIVLPAIHKKRQEVDDLFVKHLQTEPSNGDAVYLTKAARRHLRKKFLGADAAITGVNFAVAQTGEIVICTNEGNADMGVHLAPVHIASMGIEKLVPHRRDLGVFLRLLARSATGQSVTTYSSHFRTPEPGREIHLILVDNGRTQQLAREKYRKSLACIRCGACMNTCPIYRRSGGHSYGAVIPGPIGAILSPGIDMKKHADLPFATTLCGSCSDVCPVKINIHEQLYFWRQDIMAQPGQGGVKKVASKMAGWLFVHPALYRLGGKVARMALKVLPRWMVYHRFNAWGRARELPHNPGPSFQEWYRNREKRS